MAQNTPFNPGFSMAGAVDLESLKHTVEAEPGEAGGAPAAGGYVIDTTESTFQSMVQTSATFPILVLCWVSTDDRLFGFARTLAETVNGLEGKIQLARIDIAQNPSIAQALQVQAAPALFGLVGGRPIPILQGLPQAGELEQITQQLIPQIIAMAQQSGVTGVAPYTESAQHNSDDESPDVQSGEEAIPAEHRHAHELAQEGKFAEAAEAYGKLIEDNPHDVLALRERAKALLLARSGHADVRAVRQAAGDHVDDVDAQLAVADIDMLGGMVDDAFGRLLDFAAAHRESLSQIRERLVEYFAMLPSDDPRVKRSRQRLATLLY